MKKIKQLLPSIIGVLLAEAFCPGVMLVMSFFPERCNPKFTTLEGLKIGLLMDVSFTALILFGMLVLFLTTIGLCRHDHGD